MTTLFVGGTCELVWRQACNHILSQHGECYNAILEIEDPNTIDADWLKRFNPHELGFGFDVISDVANTIFPLKTCRNSADRGDFYARYQRAHERRKNRNRAWGTYFLRLIDFGAGGVNQLERAIQSMCSWKDNHKAVIVLHLSSAETDGIRMRGGPCLQYIQLICPDKNTVNLVAVYRNHDYFNKALGNLIGLCRLLQYVASETGRSAGTMTCHSIHAYFDVSQANMNVLLAR